MKKAVDNQDGAGAEEVEVDTMQGKPSLYYLLCFFWIIYGNKTIDL